MSINEFNVLLIDDDEDDYVILKALFSEIPRSKYNITWKSSYRDGLEALRTGKHDVCLLDYRLGERTGIELLEEVSRLEYMCPIIVLTGYSDFNLDIQAMQMGASEYLVKSQLTAPLLERSLRYTIKHAMDMQELKESKAKIIQQDRLASLGLLASSLAHEIGTPLGVIRSRSELMKKNFSSDEVSMQNMQTIILQIDKISKLVNSLLNLAREKQSDFAGLVDLNQVLEDVLSLVRFMLERSEIAVDVMIQKGTIVKAEAGPLGQVLLNLLVNSIHAIEQAKKEGRKTGHKVNIRVNNFLDSIEIVVQDTGCGISGKNLSQLFKPFFTTKDVGQGTGLGLAISLKIVQSWGGSITAESQSGEGATFRVRLQRG